MKRKLFLVAFLCLVLATFSHAGLYETEPNNDAEQSDFLESGVPIDGQLSGKPENNYIYYLPYFSSYHSDWTGIALSNASNDHVASVKVEVYDTNGNLLTEINNNLSISGKISFPIDNAGSNYGWMHVSSDQPLSGLAFIGHESLMADIPFVSELERYLVIPHIAQSVAWDTTIMICNPQDEDVSINLVNVNDHGEMVFQEGLTLAANSSGSYLMSDLFGGIALAGKIYLQSSSGIAAFALYSDMKSAGNYFAGINAVAEVYINNSIDFDGDGYTSDVDCDDNDATINPGAVDICEDGVDQNCSGKDGDCIVDSPSDLAGVWNGVHTMSAGGESCLWDFTVTLENDMTFSAVSVLIKDRSPSVTCTAARATGSWSLQKDVVTLETTWSTVDLMGDNYDHLRITSENSATQDETDMWYGHTITKTGNYYRK